MTLVDSHHRELGVKPACDALGVFRTTWYRRRARTEAGSEHVRLRAHPRRIGSDERARILAVLCEERFADLTPREVHAALLSEGTDVCSPSSMYRILQENKAIRERRRIASHPRHEKPVLVATRPDQS
jgi:putative transposase